MEYADICKIISNLLLTCTGDEKQALANITLARKLISFTPKASFRQGLEKTVGWYQEDLI